MLGLRAIFTQQHGTEEKAWYEPQRITERDEVGEGKSGVPLLHCSDGVDDAGECNVSREDSEALGHRQRSLIAQHSLRMENVYNEASNKSQTDSDSLKRCHRINGKIFIFQILKATEMCTTRSGNEEIIVSDLPTAVISELC